MTTDQAIVTTAPRASKARATSNTDAPPGRATFLLTTSSAPGHSLRVLDIAQSLASRGHRVLVFAKGSMADDVKAASAEIVPYEHYLDFEDRAGFLVRVDRPTWMPHFLYRLAQIRLMLAANGPQLASELEPIIRREKVDCVVHDYFEFGAAWAAERAGVPFASAGNLGTVLTRDDLPLMLGDVPAIRPFIRIPHLAHAAINQLLPVGAARAKLGLPAYTGRTADIVRAMVSRHLHIVMAPPGFAGDIPLRDNQIFVGPTTFNGSRGARGEAPRVDPGTVVISTTTTPNDGGLFRRVLEAVAPMNVPVLATAAGADDVPSGLGPHIRIESYVAHDAVFPKARALITHGGWGAVGRAMVHGLPMLVIPIFGDQPVNAALVERAGLGRHLPLDKATPETIRAELRALLADESIRARAERTSAELKKLKSEHAAARALERLAFEHRRGATSDAVSTITA